MFQFLSGDTSIFSKKQRSRRRGITKIWPSLSVLPSYHLLLLPSAVFRKRPKTFSVEFVNSAINLTLSSHRMTLRVVCPVVLPLVFIVPTPKRSWLVSHQAFG